MSIFDIFSNRKRNKEEKRLVKEDARPVTMADLRQLKDDILNPEDEGDVEIYNKWISMTLKERRERWGYLSINNRNRLAAIISSHNKAKK